MFLLGINKDGSEDVPTLQAHIHNGQPFATYDNDNIYRCARLRGGGWWFNHCHGCNPNGRYYNNPYAGKKKKDGIIWRTAGIKYHNFDLYSFKTMTLTIMKNQN